MAISEVRGAPLSTSSDEREFTPFFVAARANLFRPLAGRYRELALLCLRSLYVRLHGPDADYGVVVTREYVRDLFARNVHLVPLPSANDESAEALDESDEHAIANSILRVLVDTGWIEIQFDQGALQRTYRFTRTGKTFIEALVYIDQRGPKTRQRNVRNTRNALAQYVHTADPYDLVDALEYAQRIVSDISDDIADLEQRKADLTRAAAGKMAEAIDTFIDYMDRVFAPDLSIRMAADSVERHRHEIDKLAEEIECWADERLERAEQRLVRQYPDLDTRGRMSPVLRLVQQARAAVDAACNVKMPELREALNGFVNRAHIIIRYASAMNGSEQRSVASLLQRLRGVSELDQDAILTSLADAMTPFQPRLPDPGSVRLYVRGERRRIEEVTPAPRLSPEEALEAALAQAEETAFAVSMSDVHQAVIEQMGDKDYLRLQNFAVTSARDLLVLSHAIESAGVGVDASPGLTVRRYSEGRYRTPHIEANDFALEKKA